MFVLCPEEDYSIVTETSALMNVCDEYFGFELKKFGMNVLLSLCVSSILQASECGGS